jgi:hypothetical protein
MSGILRHFLHGYAHGNDGESWSTVIITSVLGIFFSTHSLFHIVMLESLYFNNGCRQNHYYINS